ncbi:hypothetical protein M758_6G028400 [Ceratodon purpureus]|nr:hypothetical protein M758_6G028400 [Ceratodon purpureus]
MQSDSAYLGYQMFKCYVVNVAQMTPFNRDPIGSFECSYIQIRVFEDNRLLP